MPIRLALASKHRRIVDRLAQICSEPDLNIVARASTGKQVLQAVDRHSPDILVLDMHTPNSDAQSVLRRMERGRLLTRTVILIESDGDGALDAIRLGACGVVPMNIASTLLVKCIRGVHAGGRWLERGFAIRAVDKLLEQNARNASTSEAARVLTRRELEVARLIGKGLRNADIAKKLSITEGTAKLHAHNVYQKLK
jgi:two-component system nitrate/nitrite response regulator NarL